MEHSVPAISAYINQHHFSLRSSPFFYESTELITELSDSDLLSVVESARPMVIIFYVPWCAHCKQFVDQFVAISATFARNRAELSRKQAAQQPRLGELTRDASELSSAVLFAAINCEEFRETCFAHDLPVNYYPTVIAFNINPGAAARRSANLDLCY